MKRINLVSAALACLFTAVCFLPMALQADNGRKSRFVVVDHTDAPVAHGPSVSVFFDTVTEKSYAVFNGSGTVVVEVQTVKPRRVPARTPDDGLGGLLNDLLK